MNIVVKLYDPDRYTRYIRQIIINILSLVFLNIILLILIQKHILTYVRVFSGGITLLS